MLRLGNPKGPSREFYCIVRVIDGVVQGVRGIFHKENGTVGPFFLSPMSQGKVMERECKDTLDDTYTMDPGIQNSSEPWFNTMVRNGRQYLGLCV